MIPPPYKYSKIIFKVFLKMIMVEYLQK